MSDEPLQNPKRRGGWPKGKPRNIDKQVAATTTSMMLKMKARPNWDDDTITFVGEEGVDRLKIPQEIVEQLAHDGIALQWITRSVRGQDAPQEVSKMTRGGWTPVHQSDFDGILDGLFLPKGLDDVIGVEDAMLVARPMAIQRKAQQKQRRDAREPIAITEAQLGIGLPVSGGDHPSATRQNRINKSWERIEVNRDKIEVPE